MGMFGVPWGPVLEVLQAGTGLIGVYDQDRLDREARAKEEQKLSQMLRELADLRGRTMSGLQEAATEGRRQIHEDFDRYSTELPGKMHRRGLTGVTVKNKAKAAAHTERMDAIKQLNILTRTARMSADEQLTGLDLGIRGNVVNTPGYNPMLALSNIAGNITPYPTVEPPSDNSVLAAAVGGLSQASAEAIRAYYAQPQPSASPAVSPPPYYLASNTALAAGYYAPGTAPTIAPPPTYAGPPAPSSVSIPPPPSI